MQPRTTWAETRRPAALDGVIPVSVHRYCIFITRSVCGHHFPLKWRRAIGAEESQIRSVVSSTLPGQLRALSLVWKTPVSLRCGYNMSFTDSLPFKLLTNVRSTVYFPACFAGQASSRVRGKSSVTFHDCGNFYRQVLISFLIARIRDSNPLLYVCL